MLIAVLPSLSQIVVAFPDVIGGGSGTLVPLSAIAPLALAILIARSLASRHIHLMANAVRRTGWLDAVLLLAVDSVVACVTLLTPSGDWTVVPNVLILAGLGAIGASLLSPAVGAALVTFFVLLAVTYGRSAPGSRFIRVLQAPPDAVWPLVLAVGVTLMAGIVLVRTPHGGRTSER